MEKGFNKKDFLEYMGQTFILDNYSRTLIQNIIEYGQKNCHISKDQFVSFLAEMIPEIEIKEIVQFCNDEILTTDTIKKYKNK